MHPSPRAPSFSPDPCRGPRRGSMPIRRPASLAHPLLTAAPTQLHALLSELAETTFFRLVHVNMDSKCVHWGRAPSPAAAAAGLGAHPVAALAQPAEANADEPACESKMEDTAEPLCSLGSDESDDPFGSGAFGASERAVSLPVTANPVDATITPAEMQAELSFTEKELDCSNEELPTFWLDMCARPQPRQKGRSLSAGEVGSRAGVRAETNAVQACARPLRSPRVGGAGPLRRGWPVKGGRHSLDARRCQLVPPGIAKRQTCRPRHCYSRMPSPALLVPWR
jgi:hypothetical protein